jgi:hypothetical protein
MKRSNTKPATPKAITLKVTVADIVYKHRVVEFPSVCPGCKADLTQPGAMDGVEYSSEERPMIVEDDDVDYDPDNGPSCFDGAGSIGWLFISCRRCCRTLAEGSETDETEKTEKPALAGTGT